MMPDIAPVMWKLRDMHFRLIFGRHPEEIQCCPLGVFKDLLFDSMTADIKKSCALAGINHGLRDLLLCCSAPLLERFNVDNR